MKPRLLLALIAVLLAACDAPPSSGPSPAETAAVNTSLNTFISENWSLSDPAIYIAPNPFAATLPKTIAGMPVEVIAEGALRDRFAGREFAPQLVRVAVEKPTRPNADFHVSISIYGITGKFRVFDEGGSRHYEYSTKTGNPVLVHSWSVEH